MRPFLSLDYETSGAKEEYALQPWRVRQKLAWITTWALSMRGSDELVKTQGGILQEGDAVDHKAIYQHQVTLLRWIIAKFPDGCYVVGWNMTFDIAWMVAYALTYDGPDQTLWLLISKITWLDAMRLWKHLDSTPTFMGKRSFRLDEANERFEKAYDTYKKVDRALYFDPSPEMRAKLLAYNKGDTEATLLHCERFWPQLTPMQQRCALLEARCLVRAARANVVGMAIDREAVGKLSHALRLVGKAMAEKCAPHGVTEATIRSPAKLGKLLYEHWDKEVIKRNDPTAAEHKKAMLEDREPVGVPSTDKEVLYELGLEDDRVHNCQLWREALNLESKFMGGFKKSIDYNGFGNLSFPQSNIYGTYSGRMTYSSTQAKPTKLHIGFALHQMKRDKRFRNCVIAPEGYELVEFDAAGQEFRWMAIKSGDPTMLSLCEKGGDPHSFMASQIIEIDYKEFLDDYHNGGDNIKAERDNDRKLGKVANLSLQYRTSKKKLRVVARVQYGLPMDEEQAEHIHYTYRQSYVAVPKYWKSQTYLGKQVGYAETLAGRRVKVEGDWTGDLGFSMAQTMINFPIQGTGADQKYLALACIEDVLIEFDAHFAWDLHDGIYFYVPQGRGLAFIARVKPILDNLPYKRAWGLVPPIPLPWDAKIGTTWGNLKEVKL